MKRIVIGATVLILVCALLFSGCALVRKIIPEPMVHITYYSADDPMTSGELGHIHAIIQERMDAMEIEGYTIETNLQDGVLVLHVPHRFYNSNMDKIAYEWGGRGELAICIGEEVDGVVPMPPENTVLDNSHIASAQWMLMAVSSSKDPRPVLSLTFTEEGAKILADVTTNLAAEKGKLYTWVDHQLIADAAVSAPITDGEALLTGFTGWQTAALYAAKINSLIPFDLTAEVDFSEVEQ